ncbi:MAG: class I SAM-dependent methyltransferase, partial [Actinomycetota bacterium]|nr:class I SAM-dependent methyltransferase [Actinomycetota bacterium]
VIDVGCGGGHFLEAMTELAPDARVAGHELPGDHIGGLRARGLDVYDVPLDAIPERFSAVVLLDVAEHVRDPNLLFRQCRALLHDRGFIYVHTPRRCLWDTLFLAMVRVPGLRGLAQAWLRTRISVGHLHLWSDDALRRSLERAGFEVLVLRPEFELSFPLDTYIRRHLARWVPLRESTLAVISRAARVVFVDLRTLRNKAICVARPREAARARAVPERLGA